jgi:peptide-methionine (S)-S-oxide reductase
MADKPRIEDDEFRRAVDLLDAGDVAGLKELLARQPDLARRRIRYQGESYFWNPALIEFIAENPIRHGKLPANIVEVARVILDAGARNDQEAIDSALGLVCSGMVPRQCGVQVPLVDLLCQYGADPNAGMLPGLGYSEREAVDALVRLGARTDLAYFAATGSTLEARRAIPAADAELRHRALAWAAQYGHADIVRMLLDAGEDPNRFNPKGAHPHSTPLHQASLYGHLDVVRLLLERGARRDLKDTVYGGTALGWAEHGERAEVARLLRDED